MKHVIVITVSWYTKGEGFDRPATYIFMNHDEPFPNFWHRIARSLEVEGGIAERLKDDWSHNDQLLIIVQSGFREHEFFNHSLRVFLKRYFKKYKAQFVNNRVQ